MELIKKKSNKSIDELNIADMLCSTGYLPPRNEKDIERFERIFRDRIFKTETHVIDADSIFNRVIEEDKVRMRKTIPKTTVFDHPRALRVAQNTLEPLDDSVAESFNLLIKENKD